MVIKAIVLLKNKNKKKSRTSFNFFPRGTLGFDSSLLFTDCGIA